MTGAATLAAAAVASVGVGAYQAYSSSQQTGFADRIAGSQFGEQQGFYQMLMSLLANPQSFASNPAYTFATKAGSSAVANQMSASGYAGSGNEALALTQFGQGEAYSGLLSQEQLLASLSGLNASSSNAQNVSAGTQSSSNSFNQFMSMLPILGSTIGGTKNLFSSGGVPTYTSQYSGGGSSGGGVDFVSGGS